MHDASLDDAPVAPPARAELPAQLHESMALLDGLDESGDGNEAALWSDVRERTASAFAPYPGFVAHPYCDCSAPWFDGRPVQRDASFMAQPRLRHPRYRNHFAPQRNDVPAGLRSCAL